MDKTNKKPLPYEMIKKTETITEPKLSPDRTKIAFIKKSGSTQIISILDLGNLSVRNLTWSIDVYAGFGGAYTWSPSGKFIVYRNKKGHLYKVSTNGGASKQLTFDDKKAQAPTISNDEKHLIYLADSSKKTYLADIPTDGSKWAQQIQTDCDFIQDPKTSYDNKQIAFMGYNNPNMSWTNSRIYVKCIANENDKVKVLPAGEDESNFSVAQPKWSPNGSYLSYISDKEGYYNLWVTDLQSGSSKCLIEVDLDMIKPSWGSGNEDYAWTKDEKGIVFTLIKDGVNNLYYYDLGTNKITQITNDGGLYSFINLKDDMIYCLHEDAISPSKIISVSISSLERRELYNPSFIGIENYATVFPNHIEWRSKDSTVIKGFLYETKNSITTPPPTIIYVHGGPTDMSSGGFYPRIQFFVSRGWNVLTVNYRGSGGYGREYMMSLNGNWGVHDVDDCKSGLEHLISMGKALQDTSAIMGASAGGYTVLMSLAKYSDFYKAGISLYGVTDLYELSMKTHRLEKYYNDSLIGVLPKDKDKYFHRSPINKADKITSPLLMLQGTDDEVVDKSQAQSFIKKQRHNLGFKYKFYKNEGHGFSKDCEENALNTTLEFLNKYVINQ